MLLSSVFPLAAGSLLFLTAGLELGLKLTAGGLGVLLLSVLLLRLWLRTVLPPPSRGTIAFFHPNANGGGGGERVLWVAVAAVQQSSPAVKIAIYSGDGKSAEELAASAAACFNIAIADNFQVVSLGRKELLLPKKYPRFTLIGQAAGSVLLAFEALKQLVPETFVDSSGWAFTYPLAWLAGARVAAYVHYPTVSTDMLQRVQSGTSLYNNDDDIAASTPKSLAKLVYYYLFASLYGIAGGFAQVVMVNSSWTAAHVAQLFVTLKEARRVFPPCDTASLQALPLDRKLKRLYLVSVGQFRPEKDHSLQLRAYALARRRALAGGISSAGEAVLASRLVVCGGCRGGEDEARLAALREEAERLGLRDSVDFCVNAPFAQLAQLLGGAVGGLHTMVDEHFGISIVEYMAAGVVPIVNNSGGPKDDIVVMEEGRDGYQTTGYLCSTVEQYADAITTVLGMEQRARLRIAAAARRRAAQFSDERFKAEFLDAMAPVMPRRTILAAT